MMSEPFRELSNLRMCKCNGVYKSHHYYCSARIQFDALELRLEVMKKRALKAEQTLAGTRKGWYG